MLVHILNGAIWLLLAAVVVLPCCAWLKNTRAATFAGRTAAQWRADRTPYFATGGFVPGAEEPPPWPKRGEVVLDATDIYARWNKTAGMGKTEELIRTVGKHPALGMPYTRAPADEGWVIVQDDHCSPPRLEQRKPKE